MASKMILNSDEIVVCPKCSHGFPIEQGITRQTIDEREREYEKTLAAESERRGDGCQKRQLRMPRRNTSPR